MFMVGNTGLMFLFDVVMCALAGALIAYLFFDARK